MRKARKYLCIVLVSLSAVFLLAGCEQGLKEMRTGDDVPSSYIDVQDGTKLRDRTYYNWEPSGTDESTWAKNTTIKITYTDENGDEQSFMVKGLDSGNGDFNKLRLDAVPEGTPFTLFIDAENRKGKTFKNLTK